MSAFAVVAEFERAIAEYAGAKHGIAVDCCTNAIFLSFMRHREEGRPMTPVTVPARTYASVPMAIIHAGFEVVLRDWVWRGCYTMFQAKSPLFSVVDGAKRMRRGMYGGGFHCLSFHSKKHIPIGRGGMILTDDDEAARWLRKVRYDGRDAKPYDQESIDTLGWHMYMTPEQAARGLLLFETRSADSYDDLVEDYPDLREMPVFKHQQKLAA